MNNFIICVVNTEFLNRQVATQLLKKFKAKPKVALTFIRQSQNKETHRAANYQIIDYL